MHEASHTRENNLYLRSQKETIKTNNQVNELISQEDLVGPAKPNRVSLLGKALLGFTGAVAVGLVAITTPFITPALRKICLPYVPASDRQIANVLRLCRKGKGHTLVDLGSGDGRVVLEAAKNGYQAHGIELNPWLVLFSNIQARWQGLSNLATFSKQDLWKVELSEYDNIVIFGVSKMMPQLQEKIQNEVGPVSQIIACRFPFSWIPDDFIQEGIDSVWLYKYPFKKLDA